MVDDEYEEITESIEIDTATFAAFLATVFPDGAGTYMVTILPRDQDEESPFEIHTTRLLDEDGRAGPGVTVVRRDPHLDRKASLN